MSYCPNNCIAGEIITERQLPNGQWEESSARCPCNGNGIQTYPDPGTLPQPSDN